LRTATEGRRGARGGRGRGREPRGSERMRDARQGASSFLSPCPARPSTGGPVASPHQGGALPSPAPRRGIRRGGACGREREGERRALRSFGRGPRNEALSLSLFSLTRALPLTPNAHALQNVRRHGLRHPLPHLYPDPRPRPRPRAPAIARTRSPPHPCVRGRFLRLRPAGHRDSGPQLRGAAGAARCV